MIILQASDHERVDHKAINNCVDTIDNFSRLLFQSSQTILHEP